MATISESLSDTTDYGVNIDGPNAKEILPDIGLEDCASDDDVDLKSSQESTDADIMKAKKDFEEYVELESGGMSHENFESLWK